MIKLIVVDDQKSVRKVLGEFFENIADVSLIGFATNGKDALEIIDRYHPDVAIVDVEMPIMNGLEVTKIINKCFSQTKVLVFASQDNTQVRSQVIKAGATGFISKTTGLDEINRAVHLLSRGFSFFQFQQISQENIEPVAVLSSFSNISHRVKTAIRSDKDYSSKIWQSKPSFYPEIFTRKKYHQYALGGGKHLPISLLYLRNLTKNHLFLIGYVLGAMCCIIIFHYLQN